MIGAVIVVVLASIIITFMQIRYNKVHKALSKYEYKNGMPITEVFICNKDIKAGDLISTADIEKHAANSRLNTKERLNQSDIVGKYAKVHMYKNTIISQKFLYEGEVVNNNERIQQYDVFYLSDKLVKDDFIDIRIRFGTGEDFILLSKKQIIDISRVNAETGDKETKIWIQLTEEEILMVSSGIVDAYSNGASLYAIEYVEPYIQDKANVNYPVNGHVLNLMKENPNIVDIAIDALNNSKREKLETYFQNKDQL